MRNLVDHFNTFRKNIVGIDQEFDSPYGRQKIVYADWIASGRLYQPIEDKINHAFGPFVGNTHTETSETGLLKCRYVPFSAITSLSRGRGGSKT